ncbi:Uncharacterised protein [uncultured archaeon]|nr:Uncharacterised protein [uncultured archaeon]
MPQYVMVYKALKFKGQWVLGPYGTHEHGVVYSPTDDRSTLSVHAEGETGIFRVYDFPIKKGQKVGVSLSENIVFIPETDDKPLPPP